MSFLGQLERYGLKFAGGKVVMTGVPQTRGTIFYVDPANGSDTRDGLTPSTALDTVAAAYAKCTDGRNDIVALIGGATADSPTAAITWSKSYTHLIGLSGDLPGMGQRCRIVNSSANDLAVLFTLSGSGCIIRNIQFFDGKDKAEDGACVLVSGSRNHFENCFIAGMGDATASGPFSRAGSYSLKVTGSENYFEKCTIGLDTVARTAANSELYVTGARNHFYRCTVLSQSTTAGKFLVTIDSSGGDMRWTKFENCDFINYTSNWATGITDAFNMSITNTAYVLLRGCSLLGVGTGWANTVTRLYSADPQPNAGFGIAAAPTT